MSPVKECAESIVCFNKEPVTPKESNTKRTVLNAGQSASTKLAPEIPDGKWGWIIVFASLTLCILIDGMSFSFGLLYMELLKEFQASNSVTSWIGSIFVAVPFLYGPVASALVEKYGCRTTTFISGLISAAGFVISSKMNSLGIMYLTFGALSGIGRGVCYVTGTVSVTFWFDKKRTLAMGLCSSGTGIGAFIFPPLTNYLINEYGWRGTTLVLGGIFLNTCVCGALMRDPDYITKSQLSKGNKLNHNQTELMSLKVPNIIKSDEDILDKTKSTYVKKNHLMESGNIAAQAPLLNDGCSKIYGSKPSNNISFHTTRRSSLLHRGENFKTSSRKLSSISCPNLDREPRSTLQQNELEKWYTELLVLVKTILDFSLFLELHFFLLCLSCLVLYTWLIIPFFYIADHMTKYGYTNEAASHAVSIMGITNTIGMVALGWVGSSPRMNITKILALCLVMGGVSCAGIMYFSTNFILLLVSISLYGLFVAGTFSYTPEVIVQLLPLDQFTKASGLILFCYGIGMLVGPPYAGHLYDVTKSWEQPFYQAAMWICISGVIIAIIPYTKNRKICGNGPVLRETEGVEDNLLLSSAFILILLALFVTVLYFSINCLL